MNAVTPTPIPGGQKGIIRNKGDVFSSLSSHIPLNQFHLPDHIYRADLIPEDILQQSYEDRRLLLDSASIPLTFTHGYPALNETTPFWEQLPSEPHDAFDAYMLFLELPQKSNHDNPIRLLPMISELTKTPIDVITQWCHIYYWHWRSRAYDLFLVACHRKQREQRIMSIEGQHFKMAESLLEKANKLATLKLDQELQAFEEDQDSMTETKVKDLISTIKDLVAVQRISVGLPSGGPSSIALKLDTQRNQTAEETFKHIATEGAGEQKQQTRSQEMDVLLQNPDDLSSIQELLVRTLRPNHVLPAWGDGETITIDNDPTSHDRDEDEAI